MASTAKIAWTTSGATAACHIGSQFALLHCTKGANLTAGDRSPAGNQLAFLELPGNEHFLELCYSPDYKLAVPEDLMHTAVGYPDLIAKCDELEKKGVAIWPDGWREKFSSGKMKMAFVTDPDGYEVELLERA